MVILRSEVCLDDALNDFLPNFVHLLRDVCQYVVHLELFDGLAIFILDLVLQYLQEFQDFVLLRKNELGRIDYLNGQVIAD